MDYCTFLVEWPVTAGQGCQNPTRSYKRQEIGVGMWPLG